MGDKDSVAYDPSARFVGTSPSRNPRWGGSLFQAAFFGGSNS
jgi:hypothetical protein